MQRQYIGTSQDLFQRLQPDAETAGRVLAQEGVVADDSHPEGLGSARDFAPYPSGADQPERLAVQLGAAEARSIPLAVLHGAIGGGHSPDQGKQQCECEFRGRDGVPGRRVHDGDALLGGGIHVNRVHPDPSPADHLETGRASQRSSRDAGRATDNHRIGLGERFCQRIILQARTFNQSKAGIVGDGGETLPSDLVRHQDAIAAHERSTSSST